MTPTAKEKAAFAALLKDLPRQGAAQRRRQRMNRLADRLQIAADTLQAQHRLTP